MGKLSIEDNVLRIPCANCGQEIEKTIGWLKNHGDFICTCGMTFKVQDIERVLKQHEDAINKFRRDIRKSFGKLR